jgi:hypothetical protein
MNGQRRRWIERSTALAAFAISPLGAATATDLTRTKERFAMQHDETAAATNFDFLFGRWRIDNERLKERLVGSNDWERFEASGECRPVLGGVGNVDSFDTTWNGGFRGMTLRLLNLDTRQWSIYWASNRSGVLEPPVVGAFESGVGRFFGRDTHKGIPVLARFIWSEITPTSAHWQQAFSTDEGKTWETNWHMRMSRVAH